MRKIVKNYKNDDITIVWKPELCIHSAICRKGLIVVFDPQKRPWINPYGASSEMIMEQIYKCPSKALSYFKNDEKDKETNIQADNNKEKTRIEIIKDGPLIVHGDVILKNSDGSESNRREVCALCRCGASKNKPFCDGAHIEINFKG